MLRRAKAESNRMLDFSAERLRLVVENKRLKKEVATLQSLEDLRGKQNEEQEEKVEHLDVALDEMQKELDSREATIKGLRQEVVKGVDNSKKAEGLAIQLSTECSKKDQLIEKL